MALGPPILRILLQLPFILFTLLELWVLDQRPHARSSTHLLQPFRVCYGPQLERPPQGLLTSEEISRGHGEFWEFGVAAEKDAFMD